MSNKNFFITNFLSFIIDENSFFKKNKSKFIVFFNELIKKSYPQIDLEKEYIELFYENLFIKPYLKKGNFSHIVDFLNYLQQKHIEFEIINKTFLLLANQYIKYIFPTSSIEKLKRLTLLLEFYTENLKSHIELSDKEFSLPQEVYQIFKNQKTIYLFGVYKGIPISHNSKIINVDTKKNTIEVNSNNYQIVASKFQKEIYILEPKSNLTLKAFVEKSNPVRKTLTLMNLEKITREITKRNYIRVQPKEKIKAFIIDKNQIFEGIIYDISLKGISILSKKIPLEINQYAEIEFSLNIKEKHNFSIMAQLRSISSYQDKIRYHFYFEPDKKEEILLEKYTKKREKEIIKELMFYLKSTFIDA